jgi:hypothetical protein
VEFARLKSSLVGQPDEVFVGVDLFLGHYQLSIAM